MSMTRAICILFAASLAGAATLPVPDRYHTIQAALDAAEDGDTVEVAPGTYELEESIVFNRNRSPEDPVKNITLRSSGGRTRTIIQPVWRDLGDPTFPILKLENGEGEQTVVAGFTITDGWEEGIVCLRESSPIIRDCIISKNRLGGVRCRDGSSPRISDCILQENFAGTASALSFNDGSTAEVVDCTIRGNSTGGIFFPHHNGGSIVCWRSSPTFRNCTITDNWGTLGGGLACAKGSSPTVIGCSIIDNKADGSPSGLTCEEDSSPTVTACTISGNTTSRSGGGVYCSGDSCPILTDCTISGNSAEERGGGICVLENARPTFTDCTIAENAAVEAGSAIYVQGAAPVLNGCAIERNPGYAVACSAAGAPTFTACTIGSNGGGLWSGADGAPILLACSVGSNHAYGLVVAPGGGMALTNCTLWGNRGGGAQLGAGATVTFMNCTISLNDGHGLVCEETAPRSTNCIVWGNRQARICGEASHCLTDRNPRFRDEGDLNFNRFVTVAIDEVSHRLPDFVTTEPDFRLMSQSPAIDAGTDGGAPFHDMAGEIRPCGRRFDIGAYEYGNCKPIAFIRGETNLDERVNIADAVYILSYLFTGGDEPSCLDAADANDDGAVNVADAVTILSFFFLGADPPPPPFPECGIEETADAVSCAAYLPCRFR